MGADVDCNLIGLFGGRCARIEAIPASLVVVVQPLAWVCLKTIERVHPENGAIRRTSDGSGPTVQCDRQS
ncbi:MAG: hypothetical protein OJF47_000868 [Nitrospira sp.]|nr:MAG: hypothetical protein OJF47_000868 [Nitrospira sp.]